MRILFSLLLFSFPMLGEEVEALLIPYRLVDLAFPQDGIIRNINFREGQLVPSGNVLARQDDLNESLRPEHASKVLEQRQFDAESHQKLFDKSMVSKDVYLEKKLAHEVSQIEMKRAQVQRDQRRLLAPFNGVVVQLNGQEGEWMRSGEVIFRLFDPASLYAEALLEPDQASQLKVGQRTTVVGKTSSQGKVEFISPIIDATSNLVRVKILIDNRELNWKAGATVKIRLP